MLIVNACFDHFGVWYSSLCLIITVIICILSSRLKGSPQIRKPIKTTYIILCFLTIILNVSMLIVWTTCKTQTSLVLLILINISRYLTLIGTLLILILRLYFTFKDSNLRISKCQQWLLIITYLFLTVWLIVYFIFDVVINISNWYLFAFTLGASGMIYFALSIYCMILFAQKMYKLIKMRFKAGTEMKLNFQQEKLLYVTTKYVTLLSIAMISTWITVIFAICYSWLCLFGRIDEEYCVYSVWMEVRCTDSLINIICLYLQFPFAKNIYNRYCLYCRNCCQYVLTRRTFLSREANVVALTPVDESI